MPLRSHPANGGRPGAARFNQAVYHRGLLYLSGQIIDNTKAPGMDTYYGQTKELLRQVEQLLEASRSDMDHLLQVSFQHCCIQHHFGHMRACDHRPGQGRQSSCCTRKSSC